MKCWIVCSDSHKVTVAVHFQHSSHACKSFDCNQSGDEAQKQIPNSYFQRAMQKEEEYTVLTLKRKLMRF